MEDNLPISLKIKLIANAYGRVLNNHMQSVDLTSSQAHIIGFLVRNGGGAVCQRDIENEFGLKHPTVTGLLARLEEKGFVEFSPASNDRRCKHINLTQKSRDTFKESRELIKQTDSELFSLLTPEEIDTLSNILDKVLQNIKEPVRFHRKEECK